MSTVFDSYGIKIVEYLPHHREDCKELLCQLQEYLVRVDDENVQTIKEDYKDKYFEYVERQIRKCDGIILVAEANGKAVGMIAGLIEEKDEVDSITNRCPRRGIITELVVDEKTRGSGIGKKLIERMEKYFTNKNCEFVVVDVFGPNKNAQMFYESLGFSPRNIELYKKVAY